MFIRLSAALVAACAASAFAQVPWVNDSGSNTNFSWSNGGSDNGLFGDPLVTPSGFLFTPANFNAEANDIDGSNDATSDRLFVDITPDAGFAVTGVRITELGNYNLTGEGSSVEASADLTVSSLSGPAFSVSDAMDTNPLFPLVHTGNDLNGSWNGLAEVTIPLSSSSFRIEVTNGLLAFSSDGGTAFISKIVVGGSFAVQLIPAPGALAGLGLGLVAMGRRRR